MGATISRGRAAIPKKKILPHPGLCTGEAHRSSVTGTTGLVTGTLLVFSWNCLYCGVSQYHSIVPDRRGW